ncbi:Uncharacterised protein [uncultured archaeon]|nr:Uncharacterised protein [uncultured archaeon]
MVIVIIEAHVPPEKWETPKEDGQVRDKRNEAFSDSRDISHPEQG